MPERYLEFRCKTTHGDSSWECRRELGGPSVASLEAHDFSKGPYRDCRYCPTCQTMWEITIPSLKGIPVFRPLAKDARLDFVEPTDLFSQIIIHGAPVDAQ